VNWVLDGDGLPAVFYPRPHMIMTVRQVFASAELSPRGPVRWMTPITEEVCDVYVVALVEDADTESLDPVCVDHLSDSERDKWNAAEPVLYIGKTDRPLRERVEEFYRHKYEMSAPHRGGRAVMLLDCPLWLYWSPVDNAVQAENQMLKMFVENVGRFPFDNRRF
jgi:hypothetical protein